MKKYIRIIIPVLIFVAAAAFILFLPDISETGNEPQNDMPKTPTTLHVVPSSDACGNKLMITNTGDTPALMLRLNLCGEDGEQVLPVEYSDNYFHLLPGERKEVSVKWAENDTRGTRPLLKISAFNVKEFPVSL